MPFVDCTFESHAEQILMILNDAIAHSTAIYNYKALPSEFMVTWFQTKAAHQFPVIGVEAEDRKLMGFATYGIFRDRPAYKYSVEHSVYVHPDYRGQGLGLQLMERLIAIAQEQDYHTLIGGIDISNHASIRLHEKLGFTHAGTIQQAAFKFGRWLDLGFYQLILNTPRHPIDG
jgi:L-amino acid N-acyltransferase